MAAQASEALQCVGEALGQAERALEAAMAWELRTAKESLGSELRFFGPQNVHGCSAEINDHPKASSASFPRKTPAQNG
eukprot:s2366_g4.t1